MIEGSKKNYWKLFRYYLNKPWAILTLVVFFVLVVMGLSVNRIMLALLHSRPEVVVPKIEGKSLMDALQIASSLDLAIQQEGADFDESLPAGTVLRQHPPSGMKVRAGRSLRVIISKGGQVVFIPIVIGKPISEAQSMLATDGIQMGAVTEMYSLEVPKGIVISQNPSSGTVVTRGAMVDVEVSQGMPPAGVPLLPNFVGQSAKEVRDWAQGVGVSVRIKEDMKALGAPGSVIKQDPLGGQPLLEGDDIQITIIPTSSGSGKRLTYQVPTDIQEAVVRIVARDTKGENQIYEGKHGATSVVDVPVEIQSTTRFRIYVNDVLKEERVIEPK
jgi:serine/threonine-protein kinase